MRGAATLCTLGTVLLSLFHAINAIRIGDTGSPKVVRFDLQRREISNPIESDRLRKRSKKVVKTKLINDLSIYMCEVRLGNPPQKLTLYVDTGSSDLWTNAANTTFHGELAGYKPKRAYNPGASSTAALLSSDFRIRYTDGSSANGDYFTDMLRIENVKLPNFQFGLGYTSNSREGVMGIGYPENEIQVSRNKKHPYPNLPFALKNAGLIKSASYSIWLNSLYSKRGSLIFGGIDQAKYHGKLQTTSIIPNRYGIYREIVVSLTEISVGAGKGKGSQHVGGEFPISILLDTGCSLTYLPPRVTEAIYQEVGAMYNKQWDLSVIPCTQKYQDAKITFKFGTPTAAASITINLAKLILPMPLKDDGSPIAPAQSGLCLFGIFPMSDGVKLPTLGATFLRQTYIFVNLEKNEVGMAVAKSNVWRENIKEVNNGEGGRPPTEHLMRRHRLATTTSTTTSLMKAFAMPMARPDMYIGALVGLVGVIFALM
ncbi:hypothetical protein AJ78_07877 [Emergomyces pasteurianus Ep9510]|uniref:Peptidase A1 domain-containing protein n=1 Tax=Emergomyces pasteurianus Ep9510 TaxID=1447872 RepID=A0A1J9PTY6_9EURO|nr:hypothetical protein AJ78_07877 [Emergomyces pasteurianus Ep9510]